MNKNVAEDILIGIDYGEEHTGIALGRNSLVTPLLTISNNTPEGTIHEIVRYGIENKVVAFVVGLPLQADNKETKQSLKTRHFSKLLKIVSKKPVYFQNEYGTSMEALEEAIDAGASPKKRSRNDHLSAAIILRHYYQSKEQK
jgi:putative holliday junction resolvase